MYTQDEHTICDLVKFLLRELERGGVDWPPSLKPDGRVPSR